MKKNFLISSLVALAMALGLGTIEAWSGDVHASAEGENTAIVETSVTGLSFENKGFVFTLSETDYEVAPGNALPGERISEYSYLEDIVVYKGEESATLGSIAKGDTYYNMWGRANAYTVQVAEAWRTGITKVVVPAETEFPSVAYTGYTPWTADGSGVSVAPTTDEKKSFNTAFEVVFTVDGNGNFIAQKNIPAEETEIVVKNLHIRGNHVASENRDHCFLIIFLTDLDCEGSTVPIGSALFEYNTLEKIRLWTSETEYITLGEAYNGENGTKEAYYNLWGEKDSIGIQLGGYSGEDFVKITIEADCQFPSYSYTSGAVTAKKPAFVQKREAVCEPTDKEDPYMMTSWRILIDNSVPEDLPVVTEDIAVRSDDFIGIQIRGEEEDILDSGLPHCFILFYLPEDLEDFPGVDPATGASIQSSISPARAKLYNTLDNILLWTSETEYITLRDAHENEGGTKEIYYNIWGEKNCIAYELGGYHGTSFVKITILKGCEFPSYNFTELELYPTERKAYTQAATIDFIDWSPDMYFSTNWRANTEKGIATVVGVQYNVSGEDNLLTLKFDGTDYPTDGEKMVSTGGLEQIFPSNEFFSNILLDGVGVDTYMEENSSEWVNAYFNYDEYGTFTFNVPGLTKDSNVSSIILKKGFKVPAYENPTASLREYKVIYYSIESAVEFRKDANGVWTLQDKVRWKVTFDGQNEIEVVDGERISETAYPDAPVKEGYNFVGWYDGAREWRETDRVSGPLNLIAKFEESEVKTEDNNNSGCASVVGTIPATCVLVIVAALCLKKKEN